MSFSPLHTQAAALRRGGEKEVFFEGGESRAQSRLQRGDGRGGRGDVNRNTRCHCVRIQM